MLHRKENGEQVGKTKMTAENEHKTRGIARELGGRGYVLDTSRVKTSRVHRCSNHCFQRSRMIIGAFLFCGLLSHKIRSQWSKGRRGRRCSRGEGGYMNGGSSRRGSAGVHDDDGGSSPSFASSPQVTEDTGRTLAEPSSEEETTATVRQQMWRFLEVLVQLVRNVPVGAWLGYSWRRMEPDVTVGPRCGQQKKSEDEGIHRA